MSRLAEPRARRLGPAGRRARGGRLAARLQQFIAQYGPRLAGKVIIDPTNPVGPDADGNYRKVIDAQESSGQILAGLLPAGAALVKAFGTLSAPSLAAATRQEPDRPVLFYAADDDAAGDLVAGALGLDLLEGPPARTATQLT